MASSMTIFSHVFCRQGKLYGFKIMVCLILLINNIFYSLPTWFCKNHQYSQHGCPQYPSSSSLIAFWMVHLFRMTTKTFQNGRCVYCQREGSQLIKMTLERMVKIFSIIYHYIREDNFIAKKWIPERVCLDEV